MTTQKTLVQYWDCNCLSSYIHHKKDRRFCPACGAHEEEQPDSLSDEVNQRENHYWASPQWNIERAD
jgi:NADH pyrophosphatase NudC (nudix superfamily)